MTRPGNGFGRSLRPGPRDRARLDQELPGDAEFRRVLARWLADVELVSAERGEA